MAEEIRKGFKDKAGNKVRLSAKVENATGGNFAGFDADGNVVDLNKKPSDFALAADYVAKPANENYEEDKIVVFGADKTIIKGSLSMDELDTAIKNLVKYGVLYSYNSSYSNIPYITIVTSDREYVVDTEASGEILARISSVQEGIFIPIKVKVVHGENDYDYHIGYYYTDGTNKNIHLEGLVFEYDTTNNVWLPAQACLIGSQVPHWEKVTSGSVTVYTGEGYSYFLLPPGEVPNLPYGTPLHLVNASTDVMYKGIVLYTSSPSPSMSVRVSNASIPEGSYHILSLVNLDHITSLDATPTQGSYKLLTSGAVYTALHALEERVAALEALHAEEAEPSAES